MTNYEQFEILVAELEKKPDLARRYPEGGIPSNFKQQWEELSFVVNAHGPPNRNADGWQKVWRDLKFQTKKKLFAIKVELNAIRGGPFNQYALNPLEESVARILRFHKEQNLKDTFQGVNCVAAHTETKGIEVYIVEDEVFNLGSRQEQELPEANIVEDEVLELKLPKQEFPEAVIVVDEVLELELPPEQELSHAYIVKDNVLDLSLSQQHELPTLSKRTVLPDNNGSIPKRKNPNFSETLLGDENAKQTELPKGMSNV